MRNVDEYIDCLPGEQQALCSLIRELLLELVPGIQEKLSYKLPFYHYFGMFVFLNATKGGVDVGFCRGKDLVEAFPQLERANRAIMANVHIREKKDIARLELRQLILAAAEWNEEAKRRKIPFLLKAAKKKK